MPKKGLVAPVKNQPSVLNIGVTSEVFPFPVDEKAFADAKQFIQKCQEVLVGQTVHVRGDYWPGALSHEKNILYLCRVVR